MKYCNLIGQLHIVYETYRKPVLKSFDFDIHTCMFTIEKGEKKNIFGLQMQQSHSLEVTYMYEHSRQFLNMVF